MIQKLIALGVSVSVLLTSLPAYAGEIPKAIPPFSKIEIAVPENLGRGEDAALGTQAKTVIYIQDAHDSLEAQENIAKLIQHFVNQYGVQTVLEEGYEGAVPTDRYFGKIEDPELRRRAAYFLMDKLRLSGAEYAKIVSDSVDSQQTTVYRKEKILKRLNSSFSQSDQPFNSGPSTVVRGRSFDLIGADSFKLHKQSVERYRDSVKFREETREDLQNILREIEKISEKLFPKTLREWMVLKGKLDRRELQLADYLSRLRQLFFKETSFETFSQRYPNVSALLAARQAPDAALLKNLLASFDYKALFAEIQKIETDAAESQLGSGAALQAFRYWKFVKLLQRLNEIEVTEEEYVAARRDLARINTAEIAEFIVSQTGYSLVLSKVWEKRIQSAAGYYETAHQRDKAIAKYLHAYSVRPGRDPLVIVYGGFHKGAILEQIKRAGLSCKLVTPKISAPSPKHQAYYKELMQTGYEHLSLPKLLPTATNPPRALAFPKVTEGGARKLERLIDFSVEAARAGADIPSMDLRAREVKSKKRETRRKGEEEREEGRREEREEALRNFGGTKQRAEEPLSQVNTEILGDENFGIRSEARKRSGKTQGDLFPSGVDAEKAEEFIKAHSKNWQPLVRFFLKHLEYVDEQTYTAALQTAAEKFKAAVGDRPFVVVLQEFPDRKNLVTSEVWILRQIMEKHFLPQPAGVVKAGDLKMWLQNHGEIKNPAILLMDDAAYTGTQMLVVLEHFSGRQYRDLECHILLPYLSHGAAELISGGQKIRTVVHSANTIKSVSEIVAAHRSDLSEESLAEFESIVRGNPVSKNATLTRLWFKEADALSIFGLYWNVPLLSGKVVNAEGRVTGYIPFLPPMILGPEYRKNSETLNWFKDFIKNQQTASAQDDVRSEMREDAAERLKDNIELLKREVKEMDFPPTDAYGRGDIAARVEASLEALDEVLASVRKKQFAEAKKKIEKIMSGLPVASEINPIRIPLTEMIQIVLHAGIGLKKIESQDALPVNSETAKQMVKDIKDAADSDAEGSEAVFVFELLPDGKIRYVTSPRESRELGHIFHAYLLDQYQNSGYVISGIWDGPDFTIRAQPTIKPVPNEPEAEKHLVRSAGVLANLLIQGGIDAQKRIKIFQLGLGEEYQMSLQAIVTAAAEKIDRSEMREEAAAGEPKNADEVGAYFKELIDGAVETIRSSQTIAPFERAKLLQVASAAGEEKLLDALFESARNQKSESTTLEEIRALGALGGQRAFNQLDRFLRLMASQVEDVRSGGDKADQAVDLEILTEVASAVQLADEVNGLKAVLRELAHPGLSKQGRTALQRSIRLTSENTNIFIQEFERVYREKDPIFFTYYIALLRQGGRDLIPWAKKMMDAAAQEGPEESFTGTGLCLILLPAALGSDYRIDDILYLMKDNIGNLNHFPWLEMAIKQMIKTQPPSVKNKLLDWLFDYLQKIPEPRSEEQRPRERVKNEKISLAINLAAMGESRVAPYLTDYWHSVSDAEVKSEIEAAILILRDPRSAPVLLEIIKDPSRTVRDLIHPIAILTKISKGKKAEVDAVRNVLNREMSSSERQIILRDLYLMEARLAKIPEKKTGDTEEDTQRVWVPARIVLSDRSRRDQLQELLDQKILLSKEAGLELMPYWRDQLQRNGLDGEDIYFTLTRDPSFILDKQYSNPLLTNTSHRALVVPREHQSYVVKYSGARVPHVTPQGIAVAFQYNNHWFYGGDDPKDSLFDIEMDNAVVIENKVKQAFETDSVLRSAKTNWNISEDLFLKPMLRVNPLFVPVYLPAEKQQLYLPVKDALPLMEVPEADRKNFDLQFYIYKNPIGLDERTGILDKLPLEEPLWQPYLNAIGIQYSPSNGFMYKNKAVSEQTAKELVLLNIARRLGVFFRLIQGHLKMATMSEAQSDIATAQNVSPVTVFDYQTFSRKGFEEKRGLHDISNAVLLLEELAEVWNVSAKRTRQIEQVFISILTGRSEARSLSPLPALETVTRVPVREWDFSVLPAKGFARKMDKITDLLGSKVPFDGVLAFSIAKAAFSPLILILDLTAGLTSLAAALAQMIFSPKSRRIFLDWRRFSRVNDLRIGLLQTKEDRFKRAAVFEMWKYLDSEDSAIRGEAFSALIYAAQYLPDLNSALRVTEYSLRGRISAPLIESFKRQTEKITPTSFASQRSETRALRPEEWKVSLTGNFEDDGSRLSVGINDPMVLNGYSVLDQWSGFVEELGRRSRWESFEAFLKSRGVGELRYFRRGQHSILFDLNNGERLRVVFGEGIKVYEKILAAQEGQYLFVNQAAAVWRGLENYLVVIEPKLEVGSVVPAHYRQVKEIADREGFVLRRDDSEKMGYRQDVFGRVELNKEGAPVWTDVEDFDFNPEKAQREKNSDWLRRDAEQVYEHFVRLAKRDIEKQKKHAPPIYELSEELANAVTQRLAAGLESFGQYVMLYWDISQDKVSFNYFLREPLLQTRFSSEMLRRIKKGEPWLPPYLTERKLTVEDLSHFPKGGNSLNPVFEITQEVLSTQSQYGPVFLIGSSAGSRRITNHDLDMTVFDDGTGKFYELKRALKTAIRDDNSNIPSAHVGADFENPILAIAVTVGRYGKAYRITSKDIYEITAAQAPADVPPNIARSEMRQVTAKTFLRSPSAANYALLTEESKQQLREQTQKTLNLTNEKEDYQWPRVLASLFGAEARFEEGLLITEQDRVLGLGRSPILIQEAYQVKNPNWNQFKNIPFSVSGRWNEITSDRKKKLRKYFTEQGISPKSIVESPGRTVLVDFISTGDTAGFLLEFLEEWAKNSGVSVPRLREKTILYLLYSNDRNIVREFIEDNSTAKRWEAQIKSLFVSRAFLDISLKDEDYYQHGLGQYWPPSEWGKPLPKKKIGKKAALILFSIWDYAASNVSGSNSADVNTQRSEVRESEVFNKNFMEAVLGGSVRLVLLKLWVTFLTKMMGLLFGNEAFWEGAAVLGVGVGLGFLIGTVMFYFQNRMSTLKRMSAELMEVESALLRIKKNEPLTDVWLNQFVKDAEITISREAAKERLIDPAVYWLTGIKNVPPDVFIAMRKLLNWHEDRKEAPPGQVVILLKELSKSKSETVKDQARRLLKPYERRLRIEKKYLIRRVQGLEKQMDKRELTPYEIAGVFDSALQRLQKTLPLEDAALLNADFIYRVIKLFVRRNLIPDPRILRILMPYYAVHYSGNPNYSEAETLLLRSLELLNAKTKIDVSRPGDFAAVKDTSTETMKHFAAEEPKLFSLLANPENAKALLGYLSVLRMAFYDYEFKGMDFLMPLNHAVLAELYFEIAPQIYVTPMSDSFRRFLLFRTDANNAAQRAVEIKIPGDLKHSVSSKNIELSHLINRAFPGTVVKPLGLIKHSAAGLRMNYGNRVSLEGDFSMAVFEYFKAGNPKHYDGRRVTNLSANNFQTIANAYSNIYHGDSVRVKEKIIREAVKFVAILHETGIQAQSTPFAVDLHLENFRLVFRDRDFRVYNVGDQEVFLDWGDPIAIYGENGKLSPIVRDDLETLLNGVPFGIKAVFPDLAPNIDELIDLYIDFRKNLPSKKTSFETPEDSSAKRSEVRGEGETVKEVLRNHGIDVSQFHSVIYPFAGNYDASLLAKFKTLVFPEIHSYFLNSLSYSPQFGGVEAGQLVREGILRQLSQKNEPQVQVELNHQDYQSRDFAFSNLSPEGKRIWIHKYAGDRDEYGESDVLYRETIRKGLLRPGDLVFVHPTVRNHEARKFWSKLVAERVQLFKSNESDPDWVNPFWNIYEVTQSDIDRASSVGLERQSEKNRSEVRDQAAVLPSLDDFINGRNPQEVVVAARELVRNREKRERIFNAAKEQLAASHDSLKREKLLILIAYLGLDAFDQESIHFPARRTLDILQAMLEFKPDMSYQSYVEMLRVGLSAAAEGEITMGTEIEIPKNTRSEQPPLLNAAQLDRARLLAALLEVPIGKDGLIEYAFGFSNDIHDQIQIIRYFVQQGLIPREGSGYSLHMNFLIPNGLQDNQAYEFGIFLASAIALLFVRDNRLDYMARKNLPSVRIKKAESLKKSEGVTSLRRLEITLGNVIAKDPNDRAEGVFGDPSIAHERSLVLADKLYRIYLGSLGLNSAENSASAASQADAKVWAEVKLAVRTVFEQLGLSQSVLDQYPPVVGLTFGGYPESMPEIPGINDGIWDLVASAKRQARQEGHLEKTQNDLWESIENLLKRAGEVSVDEWSAEKGKSLQVGRNLNGAAANYGDGLENRSEGRFSEDEKKLSDKTETYLSNLDRNFSRSIASRIPAQRLEFGFNDSPGKNLAVRYSRNIPNFIGTLLPPVYAFTTPLVREGKNYQLYDMMPEMAVALYDPAETDLIATNYSEACTSCSEIAFHGIQDGRAVIGAAHDFNSAQYKFKDFVEYLKARQKENLKFDLVAVGYPATSDAEAAVIALQSEMHKMDIPFVMFPRHIQLGGGMVVTREGFSRITESLVTYKPRLWSGRDGATDDNRSESRGQGGGEKNKTLKTSSSRETDAAVNQRQNEANLRNSAVKVPYRSEMRESSSIDAQGKRYGELLRQSAKNPEELSGQDLWAAYLDAKEALRTEQGETLGVSLSYEDFLEQLPILSGRFLGSGQVSQSWKSVLRAKISAWNQQSPDKKIVILGLEEESWKQGRPARGWEMSQVIGFIEAAGGVVSWPQVREVFGEEADQLIQAQGGLEKFQRRQRQKGETVPYIFDNKEYDRLVKILQYLDSRDGLASRPEINSHLNGKLESISSANLFGIPDSDQFLQDLNQNRKISSLRGSEKKPLLALLDSRSQTRELMEALRNDRFFGMPSISSVAEILGKNPQTISDQLAKFDAITMKYAGMTGLEFMNENGALKGLPRIEIAYGSKVRAQQEVVAALEAMHGVANIAEIAARLSKGEDSVLRVVEQMDFERINYYHERLGKIPVKVIRRKETRQKNNSRFVDGKKRRILTDELAQLLQAEVEKLTAKSENASYEAFRFSAVPVLYEAAVARFDKPLPDRMVIEKERLDFFAQVLDAVLDSLPGVDYSKKRQNGRNQFLRIGVERALNQAGRNLTEENLEAFKIALNEQAKFYSEERPAASHRSESRKRPQFIQNLLNTKELASVYLHSASQAAWSVRPLLLLMMLEALGFKRIHILVQKYYAFLENFNLKHGVYRALNLLDEELLARIEKDALQSKEKRERWALSTIYVRRLADWLFRLLDAPDQKRTPARTGLDSGQTLLRDLETQTSLFYSIQKFIKKHPDLNQKELFGEYAKSNPELIAKASPETLYRLKRALRLYVMDHARVKAIAGAAGLSFNKPVYFDLSVPGDRKRLEENEPLLTFVKQALRFDPLLAKHRVSFGVNVYPDVIHLKVDYFTMAHYYLRLKEPDKEWGEEELLKTSPSLGRYLGGLPDMKMPYDHRGIVFFEVQSYKKFERVRDFEVSKVAWHEMHHRFYSAYYWQEISRRFELDKKRSPKKRIALTAELEQLQNEFVAIASDGRLTRGHGFIRNILDDYYYEKFQIKERNPRLERVVKQFQEAISEIVSAKTLEYRLQGRDFDSAFQEANNFSAVVLFNVPFTHIRELNRLAAAIYKKISTDLSGKINQGAEDEKLQRQLKIISKFDTVWEFNLKNSEFPQRIDNSRFADQPRKELEYLRYLAVIARDSALRSEARDFSRKRQGADKNKAVSHTVGRAYSAGESVRTQIKEGGLVRIFVDASAAVKNPEAAAGELAALAEMPNTKVILFNMKNTVENQWRQILESFPRGKFQKIPSGLNEALEGYRGQAESVHLIHYQFPNTESSTVETIPDWAKDRVVVLSGETGSLTYGVTQIGKLLKALPLRESLPEAEIWFDPERGKFVVSDSKASWMSALIEAQFSVAFARAA